MTKQSDTSDCQLLREIQTVMPFFIMKIHTGIASLFVMAGAISPGRRILASAMTFGSWERPAIRLRSMIFGARAPGLSLCPSSSRLPIEVGRNRNMNWQCASAMVPMFLSMFQQLHDI
jgi:hypothetical protein